MSELRLKMQSRENESSRVLELASSDMDKMHSTVEQVRVRVQSGAFLRGDLI